MQRGSNSSNINNRMLAHPACASCKHQRKRCTENCALAPYFPAEKTLEFQAVHKVFGVSNVVKLVKDVIAERRKGRRWTRWTNNRGSGIGGGLASNNMASYDNEKMIFDSIQHSYHWNYVQSTLDISKQERDASSLLLLQSPPPPPPLPQHHSFNGFNQQQYYLPGEFGSMDSTLFIGSEED
ncbi:LOB DOMAIN-CONTAINING PROTEIN 4-RELATED [Salix koriyanagi]|uniref:LOB DOMAIN-CONTAINING PROTEIN 4-RELATED n=1 Tax=Salix koriyanagi TaxID=2511006 RepID=A0A9Q0W8L5_9ROSI|nr:LOB DOMAIN-CONTAINING PROTEIN 4-RELATED [Salix koriyanagi]